MSDESDSQYGTGSDERQETDEAHADHHGNGNGNGNGQSRLMVASAAALFRRGIMPIPLLHETGDPKEIKRPGWKEERYLPENVAQDFAFAKSVGARWGYLTAEDGRVLSDHVIDLDLDTLAAIRIADMYLPATECRWGRESKPNSHWIYRLTSLEGLPQHVYSDPEAQVDLSGRRRKATLFELRSDGHTVAPESVNVASGVPEPVRYQHDGDGMPTLITPEDLSGVPTFAAAVLVARHWGGEDRHNTALPLAGMLWHGGLGEADALKFMRAICIAARDEQMDNRLQCVIDSYRKGLAGEKVEGAPALETGGHLPKSVIALVRTWLNLSHTAYGGDIGPDGFMLSDIGNAERFQSRWAGQVLFSDDQNEAYIYDGRRWAVDKKQIVTARGVEVVKGFIAHTIDPKAPKEGNTTPKQWATHARHMGERKQIGSMISIAKALLPVVPDELDPDAYLLNVKNGTVELHVKTGEIHFHEHRAGDLITLLWDATYDAEHDGHDSDLDHYRAQFMPEADRWDFLEQAGGRSLTGDPKRENFQLLGDSNAGKSMFLRMLRAGAGDYGQELAADALKADEHGAGRTRTDLLDLRGKRAVVIPEVGDGALFGAALFKTMLSGGDVYKTRGAYQRRTQSFPFVCTLWTSGNKPYGLAADDDGAYERIHVIKFGHPLPKTKRRSTEEERIVRSASVHDALLACFLRGFKKLYGARAGCSCRRIRWCVRPKPSDTSSIPMR